MKKEFFLLIMLMFFTGICISQTENTRSDNNSTDTPYTVVEEEPEYPGGIEALSRFLAANIKYPERARSNGITGKVYVSFVVERDGSLSNYRIIRDIGGGCGEEVIRVLMIMPKWKPGRHHGETVRVKFNLPVNFDLSEYNPPSNTDNSQRSKKNNDVNEYECDFTYSTNGKEICFTILSKTERTCAVSSVQSIFDGGVIIPSSVPYDNSNYKVVEIGEEAFSMMGGITSISIPSSIKKIGARAFYGCKLTLLVVPKSVVSIGENAFYGISRVRYDGSALGYPWGAKEVVSSNGTPSHITKSGGNTNQPYSPSSKPCPSHTKVPTTEAQIRESISKSNDGISGMYEDVTDSKSRLAVLGDGSSYYIYYLSGASNNCWELGHVKAKLRPTATTGLFKGTWYMADFSENDNCIVAFDGVKMDIVIGAQKMMFLKMYPKQENTPVTSDEPRDIYTGTGWALGKDYLVTNNHVIEGMRTITVKGIGGDHSIGYRAKVVATDKINDIAVLKIDDSHFKGFGTIPYAVSSRMAEVLEEVMVVGYPLTQYLGNNVKPTKGEINSRTGYQGDVSTYQISAPIQPGSSGGPMFDNKGNVIGIVVAGIPGAENVGYAIKTSYLKILIESEGLNISFPTNNTISSLSQTEKFKRVKKFVFFIECTK